MSIALGPRLRAIAEYLPSGCRLVDIGSDHGYLPAWLLLQRRVDKAIAGEINADPAARAQSTCRAYDLWPRMEVRLGDGLAVLAPGEADAIVVAGMGGATIRGILERGRSQLAAMRRLVLQPNVAGADLRRWLVANRFAIVAETLVEENAVIYEVIVAEPGATEPLNDLEALLGPVVVRQRPPLFCRRVELLIGEREYVLSQLAKSSSPLALTKREELEREIRELKAVIV